MWSEIDAEYPKLLAPEPDVTCYYQQARLAAATWRCSMTPKSSG
jgi:hypothetical protein